MHAILDRKPDLLLSGINHGSNAAVNNIYSGTMGATMEGCIIGIPSVGFSLLDHSMNAILQAADSLYLGDYRQYPGQRTPRGHMSQRQFPRRL